MQPEPSTSAGTPTTAASTSGDGTPTTIDGVPDAVVVASTSGSPPPPVHVQQQQQEEQLFFYDRASFKQCQQLFGMTCGIKLLRCDAGVSADSRSVRKVEIESDTDSNSSDDDEIKVFPAPCPQPAAQKGSTVGTKKKLGERGIQRKSSSDRCTICRKTYSSKKYLKIHMRSHTGDNRYRCDNCGASFWNRCTLTGHKKRMTEQNGVCPPRMSGGWRPKEAWTCKICGRRFKQPSYYAIHMRIHRGEKPFKCDVCGKTFPGSTWLCQHQKVHTGVMPHMCVFCDKGFHQKSSYWSHLRGHTEEKPFFCKVTGCGASFRQSGSLKKHRRTVHSKKD